ncbi:MAG: hypothetical protein DELT_00062 [Desulfovibrio sp.]
MQKLPDPRPIFERYETLAREADALFDRVKTAHPECVTCHKGCADCCHALFDLPLIEAAYINDVFHKTFGTGAERSRILERAYDADRATHAVKRKAFAAQKAGESVAVILEEIAKKRIRCPLLGDDGKCALYEARPVTCRIYGVPTSIDGTGHVCGRAAFLPGKAYPTANMDRIHERLAVLSLDLSRHMQSGFAEMHTVLVPLSMALITSYDAAYYGLDKNRG